MKDKLQLIQIGVGGWGFSWADIAKKAKEWDVVSYVDIDPKNLKLAAKTYDMNPKQCFTDLDLALIREKADAALIVVPPAVHKEIAIKCLRAGLHVLIEKPIAENIEDAKEMVTETEVKKLKLMVSQNYRFKEAPRTVKKILERQIVGRPDHVFVNFHKAPRFTTKYRLNMPYPLFRDMAIHHFDQMRYLLGVNPISVQARSWNPGWSWFKGDPVVSILIEMEQNIWISYNGSWVSQGWETTWDGDWRIECEEGEIYWANNRVIVKPSIIYKSVYNEGLLEIEDGTFNCELVHMASEDREYCLHEFYNSITDDREPETSGFDNLQSIAITLLSVESAKREGEKIKLQDFIN